VEAQVLIDHDIEVQLEAFTISERGSWRQTSASFACNPCRNSYG
jgi:hypothetical protein